MSYRDDHEAALARIAALEAQLRERPEVVVPEPERPESEHEWYAAEVRRVERERDQIKAQLATIERARGAHGLPTVWERNRAFDPLTTGEPAGVACPQCRAARIDVEMAHEVGVSTVICPRCLFTARLRTK